MEPMTQQQETIAKQKNPLRTEQGRKLIEYNKRKKEELIAYNGSHVTVANDGSTLIFPDYRFPTQKSNCTTLNKWHVISVTWSNYKDISNCWSNGEKLITFNTGNVKGSDHCFIGDLGILPTNTYLIGCIGEIIGFYRSLTDKETSYIHKYLMKNWGVIDDPI